MKNLKIIVILIIYTITTSDVLSQGVEKQEVKLYSFENEAIAVCLKLDYSNERITIALNNRDSICINDFKDLIDDVKVINGKFISLQFRTKGGSGVKIREYILASVFQNKLCINLDVYSFIHSEFKTTYNKKIDSLQIYDEYNFYQLNFVTMINNKGNYVITAKEFEKVKSKVNPSLNHESQNILHFNFNLQNKVFYNQIGSLKGSYILIDYIEHQESKQDFKGEKFPTIKLKNEEYYFINQSWYLKGTENHFIKFSNSCGL